MPGPDMLPRLILPRRPVSGFPGLTPPLTVNADYSVILAHRVEAEGLMHVRRPVNASPLAGLALSCDSARGKIMHAVKRWVGMFDVKNKCWLTILLRPRSSGRKPDDLHISIGARAGTPKIVLPLSRAGRQPGRRGFPVVPVRTGTLCFALTN